MMKTPRLRTKHFEVVKIKATYDALMQGSDVFYP